MTPQVFTQDTFHGMFSLLSGVLFAVWVAGLLDVFDPAVRAPL